MQARLDYRAKSGLLAFMAQGWWRKRRGAEPGPLPDIVAGWRGQRSPVRKCAEFPSLSVMPADAEPSILYPHTASLPLLTAALSLPVLPLPVRRVLQVRNRLSLHASVAPGAVLDLADAHAGRQGFARASADPQRAIGEYLAHRGGLGHVPLRPETWIQGPVFPGAAVALRAEVEAGGRGFALRVDGEERPAIVGRHDHPIKESA